MKIKILTSLCAFFISGVTFANCPGSFNAEQMSECIKVVVASSDYQDWRKNEYPVNLDASKETTSGVRTVTSTEAPEEEPDCD